MFDVSKLSTKDLLSKLGAMIFLMADFHYFVQKMFLKRKSIINSLFSGKKKSNKQKKKKITKNNQN
jgi:hypothetical protein